MRSFNQLLWTIKLEVINKKCANSGRILLSERNIDDCLFVLIKIYNASHEAAQLKTHTDQDGIIDCVGDIQNKKYNFQW